MRCYWTTGECKSWEQESKASVQWWTDDRWRRRSPSSSRCFLFHHTSLCLPSIPSSPLLACCCYHQLCNLSSSIKSLHRPPALSVPPCVFVHCMHACMQKLASSTGPTASSDTVARPTCGAHVSISIWYEHGRCFFSYCLKKNCSIDSPARWRSS